MVRPDCGVVCVKFCKFAERGRSWQAGDYSRHLIPGRNATITKTEDKPAGAAVKEMLLSNPDGLRDVIRAMLQEVLEAEMGELLGAGKGERTPERLGYRSGY
tara:strand:+ start:311 stop:616 length:306 start_codon:yes stop_codon:yes gene_type:complete